MEIESLKFIKAYKSGDKGVLKNNKWLMLLALSQEKSVNLERVNSLDEVDTDYTFKYVERTLEYLNKYKENLSNSSTEIVEEVLKWADVSKAGMRHQREKWISEKYNVYAHNIGSAQIYYEEQTGKQVNNQHIIYTLILTHGLLGQFIRGEVSLAESMPLYKLITEGEISKSNLKEILKALNYCVISGVSEQLWERTKRDIDEAIEYVVNGQFGNELSLKERIKRLRRISIQNGECFDTEYDKLFSDSRVVKAFDELFSQADLWYVEAALYDFTLEEFVKIFLLIIKHINLSKIKHVNFERLMRSIYYEHSGKKKINVYKKRVIEKYLALNSMNTILTGNTKSNVHANFEIMHQPELDNTVFFDFKFSPAGEKLIEFSIEAEKSDMVYEKATVLLFDFFDLRRDKYDRFSNEESYLNTMNQTINYKKIILDYITGKSVADIGPGGGALMDLIEETYKDKKVIGVDIAQNVLDALEKKKQRENRNWNVKYGDALELEKYVVKGSIDTIIFSSILHELFSYIEYKGKRFNHATLETALKSAYDILPVGGRIIIRDGVMTEPKEQKRRIKFLSSEGMEFLQRYTSDFKGRNIEYTVVGQNEVMMKVNDAMEFLYTYTWGEKSYAHEINEQFGYYTPSEFKECIQRVLGDTAKIVELKHFLQDGYTLELSKKVEFFDESRNKVALPDSTLLLVIEKAENKAKKVKIDVQLVESNYIHKLSQKVR